MKDHHVHFHRLRRMAGYSLIEIIIVITIIGILAGIVAAFIIWPVQQYAISGRREVLVTEAESALRRLARDIRASLPNSVRVTDPGTGASYALEFLPVIDAGKANVQVHANCNKLDASNQDYDFDLLGMFRERSTLTTPGIRMVTNNLGPGTANDVYADAGAAIGTQAVITPSGITFEFNTSPCTGRPACTVYPGNDHICMVQGHQFRGPSPNQRMYVVTTPASYLCDTTAGTITRYYNYAIQASQPTTAAAFTAIGASSALLVENVSSCRVVSATSDVLNRGLVTLYLGLTKDDQTVKLVHQVMLDNSN